MSQPAPDDSVRTRRLALIKRVVIVVILVVVALRFGWLLLNG